MYFGFHHDFTVSLTGKIYDGATPIKVGCDGRPIG